MIRDIKNMFYQLNIIIVQYMNLQNEIYRFCTSISPYPAENESDKLLQTVEPDQPAHPRRLTRLYITD